jgi:hypothetical protein
MLTRIQERFGQRKHPGELENRMFSAWEEEIFTDCFRRRVFACFFCNAMHMQYGQSTWNSAFLPVISASAMWTLPQPLPPEICIKIQFQLCVTCTQCSFFSNKSVNTLPVFYCAMGCGILFVLCQKLHELECGIPGDDVYLNDISSSADVLTVGEWRCGSIVLDLAIRWRWYGAGNKIVCNDNVRNKTREVRKKSTWKGKVLEKWERLCY